MSEEIEVILVLDIYHDDLKGNRQWERQSWIGRMPMQKTPEEYDPLLLQKEHVYGEENMLFRLAAFDDRKNQAAYLPVVLHNTHWFLKALPNWGFEKSAHVSRIPAGHGGY